MNAIPRFPKVFDLSDCRNTIKSYNVIATEKTDLVSIFTLHFNRGEISFFVNNKEYTFDELPKKYTKFKYDLVNRAFANGRFQELIPMYRYTFYGEIIRDTYHVFAMRNQDDNFVKRERLETYAKSMNFGVFPKLYEGPFKFQTLFELTNLPSNLRDSDSKNILITAEPPVIDSVAGENTWVMARILRKPRSGEKNAKNLMFEFANVFVKPQYITLVESKLEADDDHPDNEDLLFAKIETMTTKFIRDTHRNEYEYYKSQIIREIGISKEECDKQMGKQIRKRIKELKKLYE
jgi:hypothetical protein